MVAQVGEGRNACIIIKLVGKQAHCECKDRLYFGAFEVGIQYVGEPGVQFNCCSHPLAHWRVVLGERS